jgi:transposase
VSYRSIQERLDTTAPTISRWKERFLQQRLGGLIEIRHPGQKPTVITPALQAKVLEATRRKPKDGSTHLSCRKLAAQLGVSKDTVHRVWHRAGLKPHRLERYMASDDPEFERKAAEIIGLYLNPPQHAAVFCVDEKSAIQALDRLTQYCRCHLDAPSATVSNIIVTAHCRSTPLWMCAAARFTEKRPRATPVTSFWIFCSK